MNLKNALARALRALNLFGAGITSATPQEIHLDQALKDAENAASECQNDNAKAAAEHARQALAHAELAETVKPDPHLTEAKTHFKQAIEHGDMGHAKEAVEHLKMAYKEKKTCQKNEITVD